MKNYLVESMTSLYGNLIEEHLISEYDYDEYTDDVSDAYDRGEITAEEKHAEYERLNRMLDEDYTSDLRSDVYNALADIMFKYHNKGIKVTPEQVQQAFEWFDVHFWADEDLDESCNSKPKEELKEDINIPFIKIYKEGPLAEEGWDYPIKELDYLLEEHSGESFVLKNNRLYEMTEE